jgi:Gas vesicle synthesis protein GvpL/GvpF
VGDELARWAAARAPALLARAEAEAVAELRQALVAAALDRRGASEPARRRPVPQGRAEAPPTPEGDALWAYCVLRADATLPPAGLERVEHGDLVALVSRVPLAEFGEEPLRRNLNDFDWLERVARSHEAVLERTMKAATIVPLRLCTIFKDEDGVRRMLESERGALADALERLDGRQEWGVKLIVERGALEEAARARVPEDEAVPETSGGGGAYMLRRRLERQVRAAADRLAEELAEDVHARLQDWASDAVLNPPQNRELSGHEGEMLLNGAYLVEHDRVEPLRGLIEELEGRHRELGARLELTGPWPPYNFVPRQDRT